MAETVPGTGHEPPDPFVPYEPPLPGPPPVVGPPPPSRGGGYVSSLFSNAGRGRFLPPAIRRRLLMGMSGGMDQGLFSTDVHPAYLQAMQSYQQGGWGR